MKSSCAQEGVLNKNISCVTNLVFSSSPSLPSSTNALGNAVRTFSRFPTPRCSGSQGPVRFCVEEWWLHPLQSVLPSEHGPWSSFYLESHKAYCEIVSVCLSGDIWISCHLLHTLVFDHSVDLLVGNNSHFIQTLLGTGSMHMDLCK